MHWSIHGEKDPQLVRSDWTEVGDGGIEGVVAFQMANVLTDNGYLTEIWRPDWVLDGQPVGQVFQRVLQPGAASGWHVHATTLDRLFCSVGRLRVALFDGRLDSPTHGLVADYRLGRERPATIVIPPGVWHGVRNIGTEPASLLNVVDVAYDYDDPDHYRLPLDTPSIPYRL